MSREDGGPAFPCEFVQHQRGDIGNNTPIMARASGMTLRDYFAAKAMQALIQQGAALQVHRPDGVLTMPARVGVPILAYQYADAMLAAREEDPADG